MSVSAHIVCSAVARAFYRNAQPMYWAQVTRLVGHKDESVIRAINALMSEGLIELAPAQLVHGRMIAHYQWSK